METTLVALALLALSIALAAIGLGGLTERLPRERGLGLRTRELRRSEETWRVGHRAAGRALLAAAGPPLLLAAALLVAPPPALEDWFPVYALVGLATGGLIALASRQADAAAAGLDSERPTPEHDTP